LELETTCSVAPIQNALSAPGAFCSEVGTFGWLWPAPLWSWTPESCQTRPKLIRSSAYHPQRDGQTERVNQILEDMLRACALQYDKHWDKCLPLEEFSYNNSYQTSLKMAPFEAFYGRHCRTPLSWSQTGERKVFGPDLVNEAEEKGLYRRI
jgi:hypothetical protein